MWPLGRIRRVDIHGLRFVDMLHQRGHTFGAEPGKQYDSDTFLRQLHDINRNAFNSDRFYDWFAEKTNRVKLRQSLLNADPAAMLSFDGIDLPLKGVPLDVYSKTFEWYVAELLVQDLKFIASGFRVLLKDAPQGGDYDVLGFSANELVYIEAKAGRPSNISLDELKMFVARSKHLSSTISAIYVDYDDLSSHFKFSDFLAAVDEDELYEIRDLKSNAKLYRTTFAPFYLLENSGKENVITNLRFLFRTHYALAASLQGTTAVNPESLDTRYFSCQRRVRDFGSRQ